MVIPGVCVLIGVPSTVDSLRCLSQRHKVDTAVLASDVALEPRLVEMLGTHRKKAWESVGASAGVSNIKAEAACSPEGLDLLDRMLCYDHQVGGVGPLSTRTRIYERTCDGSLYRTQGAYVPFSVGGAWLANEDVEIVGLSYRSNNFTRIFLERAPIKALEIVVLSPVPTLCYVGLSRPANRRFGIDLAG